jgi:hypothetical protein
MGRDMGGGGSRGGSRGRGGGLLRFLGRGSDRCMNGGRSN